MHPLGLLVAAAAPCAAPAISMIVATDEAAATLAARRA
jgi:hypothetical protein